MKKYFLSLVAMAAMLFATSCQESLVEPQVDGTTTFTVQVPGQMGTKATPYNGNVNQLYVQVYPENVSEDLLFQPEVVEIVDGFFTVSISLIQDQRYDIIFWAQQGESYVKKGDDLRVVSMKKHHNSEEGAAFFAYLNDFVPTGTSQPVTLKRPFAQLNLGTTEASLKPNSGEVFLSKSKVKVSNVAKVFNTVTGMGEEPVVYETTLLGVPQSTITVNSVAYQYISMDYLPIVGDDQALVTVAAEIELTNEQVISHEFTNVPVRENYRTNIVGNLISSTTDFEVEIDDKFEEDYSGTDDIISNDYYVVDNVDQAESKFAAGETHIAINHIKNGESLDIPSTSQETLYLQLPDVNAEFTVNVPQEVKKLYITVPNTDESNVGLDLIVNAPNSTVEIKDSQLNTINGTTAQNTLILNGVIVNEVVVQKGNVVVGEGTVIGSKIIISISESEEEAIVIINGTGKEITVEGDDVVVVEGTQDEINVSNVNELRAAVNTIDAGGVINIKNDIADVNQFISINKNITINGDDKSISGAASRIFRICSSELNVEMNDLNIVSTAVRNGTNDIRGISLDPDLKNVTLTLNNCSVDFTDGSACDWSYGVNFSGGTTKNHTLIINGGVYEGANVINTNGVGHTIKVKNTVLTSLYQNSDFEQNYGACIYLKINGESTLEVENNTFNGANAVAINTCEGNSVDEKDNIDNTKRVKVKVENNYFYTLAEAVESIESEGEITIIRNLEIEETIINDKIITLNLNNKTITGVDDKDGNYSLINNQGTLTINGPGKMTLSIAEGIEKASGAYSAVIANTPGCSLTINDNAEIKHLNEGYDAVYEPKPVVRIGNTEYYSIDDAIVAWTNNTTLTLLADVTLSDVVTLKSTEHHILDLSTHTMTAASGKNAFVIKACGTGDAERTAITIKADTDNPGGINAGKKCIIYYDYTDGGISGNDRPIIKIEGGVFTGSTSSFGTSGIYVKGSAARKAATINISGGTFNCSINGSGKSKLLISGGVFHYSVGSQGDSTALRLIWGGRFKTLGFMTADSNNTKFWFGTSMGNSNVGLYIDDEGYLVVGGPVITEFGDKFIAKATNPTKWSSYLQYSSAAEYGLYYTNAELAIKKHGEANVVLK